MRGLTIERKIVRNTEYLYVSYYDPGTKGKKELYCGPVTDSKARGRARDLEKQYLQKQLSSIHDQLKSLERESLVEFERPFCKPFVKWAGGKSQLVAKMFKQVPETFTRYYEPFLGGAAFYFYLTRMRKDSFPATLSDINRDLINVYQVIRDDVDGLMRDLGKRQREFQKQPNEEARSDYYYTTRDSPPNIDNERIERAGWFIFINKTCYNGLWRVNSSGAFNVPYGRPSPKVSIFEKDNLKNIHSLLNQKGVEIVWGDYAKVLENVEPNSFCYFDPPYYSETKKGFTAYTASLFSEKDQQDLADLVKKLAERGVKILVSNADTKFIRDLYEEKGPKDMPYSYDSVEALRVINCVGSARNNKTREILIKDY